MYNGMEVLIVKVYLRLDDHDKHGMGCECGKCNSSGHSYGVGIYEFTCECNGHDTCCEHEDMLNSCPEPIERVYSCSEESAYSEAERVCKEKGYAIMSGR